MCIGGALTNLKRPSEARPPSERSEPTGREASPASVTVWQAKGTTHKQAPHKRSQCLCTTIELDRGGGKGGGRPPPNTGPEARRAPSSVASAGGATALATLLGRGFNAVG
jgi:hypothetical protein